MKDSILLEREYDFPIEKVWEAISTQKALATWLMPNNFQLKEGFKFSFQAPKQPFFDGTVHCEVIGFQEPTFLQYSWQGGPMKRPTVVTFRLVELDSNKTLLRFEHSGFSGFFNQLVVRRILSSGWKGLLSESILKALKDG